VNCIDKRRYKTREAAERRAAKDLKQFGVRQRVYVCGKCSGGFHLSRLPFDEFLARCTDQTLRETAEALRQEHIRDEVRWLRQRVEEIARLIEEDRRKA